MTNVVAIGRRVVHACVMATAFAAVACGGSSSNPAAPSTTSIPPTAEIFTGTVPARGIDIHAFAVKYNGGGIDATLTAAGPPSGIFMGLGFGTWVDPVCTPISGATTVTPAGTTAQLSGTSNAGNFCVAVYDVGNQTGDITYSVTVNHY